MAAFVVRRTEALQKGSVHEVGRFNMVMLTLGVCGKVGDLGVAT